jgi:hypothetical protein
VCYEHKCNNTEELLYVKIGVEDWKLCPWSGSIKVSDYASNTRTVYSYVHNYVIQLPGYSGILLCPDKGSLCNAMPVESTTLPTPSDTSTIPSVSPHLGIIIQFND